MTEQKWTPPSVVADWAKRQQFAEIVIVGVRPDGTVTIGQSIGQLEEIRALLLAALVALPGPADQ